MITTIDPINGTCSIAMLMPHGLEDLCKEEIIGFGVSQIKERPGRLEFQSTIDIAYKLTLSSRYASRLLVEFFHCTALTKEEFYTQAITFPFEQHINCDHTIACDCRLYSAKNNPITNSMFGSQLLKDVVCDRLRSKTGKRPNIDIKYPDIRLCLTISKDKWSVALDFSGEALHKRGYKKASVAAPLKENVAAAILKRGNWEKAYSEGWVFLDPMCGSATFSIEAAYMALKISPTLHRNKFGFLKWQYHKAALYKSLKEQAKADFDNRIKTLDGFCAIDIDENAFNAAKTNIKASGLEGKIKLLQGDIFTLTPDKLYNATQLKNANNKGFIAINPPYGQRLEEINKAQYIFREIGRYFPTTFKDYKMILLAGSKELSLATALRPYKTNPIKNGAIDCVLACYDFSDNSITTIDKEKENQGKQMFLNRLQKKQKLFDSWLKKNEINCYRLYDADMPEYSVAIDVYNTQEDGTHLVIAEYAPPSTIPMQTRNRRLNIILESAPQFLNVDHNKVHLKIRKRQKGNQQYQRIRQDFNFYTVKENGLIFKVDFDRYLDTGLFLDHRLMRQLIKSMLQEKQKENPQKPLYFLNLFAYTCSASVYAASTNAITTSVDLSKTYLDWGKESMRLNNIALASHNFIQEDTFTYLKNEKKKFDLIYIDPPTFSNSKKLESDFSVEKDYLQLLLLAAKLLAPKGEILFSNNYKKFKLDFAALDAFKVKEITRTTIDLDFKSNKKIHQAWKISKKINDSL